DPRIVALDVADRQPITSDRLEPVRRRGHPERLEEPRPDDVVVLDSGDGADHPTEDAVAEIRVLEPGVWRQSRAEAAAQQLREPIQWEALLAVAPWIVGR